jgi:hypothetical protein
LSMANTKFQEKLEPEMHGSGNKPPDEESLWTINIC